MHVRKHPQFPQLHEALRAVAADHLQSWQGVIFRSAPPKWASAKHILSGQGSFKSGGRFNAPGSFPAVYGSTTPQLAMAESLAYQHRAKYSPQHAFPLLFKAIEVDVKKMLVLSSPTLFESLPLTLEQILNDSWWRSRARGEESLSQAIGRAAHSCGAEAMIAPSAEHPDLGENVVVLPDHIATGALRVLRGRVGR